MKRIRILLLVAGFSFLAAACALQASAASAAAGGPTVRLEQTGVGKILVDRSGYTRSTFYVGAEEFGGRWLAVNRPGKSVN